MEVSLLRGLSIISRGAPHIAGEWRIHSPGSHVLPLSRVMNPHPICSALQCQQVHFSTTFLSAVVGIVRGLPDLPSEKEELFPQLLGVQ